MSARTLTAGQPVLRRRATTAVLIAVAAGLGSVLPAPVAAFAASPGVSSVSAGIFHTCAIESGKAFCWGDNSNGELGDGSTGGYSSVPVAVDTSGVLAGKTLTQITAGYYDTCALDSAGAAYCWGDNVYGELGDGSTDDSSVPVAVDTSGVLAGKALTQIMTGAHTCALDSTGAAYCWGDDILGELGDGDSYPTPGVPVAVDTSGVLSGKTLTQITAGYYDTCALDSTGAAYCWGSGGLGSGVGGTGGRGVPVAVDTRGVLAGKTLTQITAGYEQTCALDSAGAAYCWGANTWGELGDGSTDSSSVPVAVDTSGVLAGKTLTQITAHEGPDTCALDSTGAAYCWGDNEFGELGDDTAADSSVPVAVNTSGLLTFTQITAGGFHTCGLDAAGAAFCWGDNGLGQLGDDTTTQNDVPVLAGPQAPAGVTAAAGDTSATVSWRAPNSLDGGTLTGYTATAAPSGAACTTASAPTCTITGLASGTTYSVTVVAHTTAGDSGASEPATVTPPPTGPIVSGYRGTRCVDDSHDSSANDTKIVIATCNGSAEQNWAIEADGTIRINGKCLDIYRESKASRAKIILYTCHGSSNQQWEAVDGTLVNPISRKCLDDPAGKTTNGTQLQIYTCNGGRNQQWQLP